MGILENLIIFLGGKCALCNIAYLEEIEKIAKSKKKKKRSWQIHHRNYRCSDCLKQIPHNAKTCPHCGGMPEKTSRDFKEKIQTVYARGKKKGQPKTKTIYLQKEYLEFIKPIVMSRPFPKEDFCPLHNSCHQAVTRLARWKKENLERLFRLALEQKD